MLAVRRALLRLALAATAALAGCQSDPGGPSRPLEVVIPTELTTLDPRFSLRSLDIKVTRLVHAGLVGLDPESLAPVPLVAKSWRWHGEKRLEVELKPGLRFHGGRPLSAADVCATLAALNDPALGSPHRAVVRAIGRCTPQGDQRVLIDLATPRATLLTDLEVPILRADQARLPPRPNGDLDGLGPYRIASLSPGAVELSAADTGLMPKPAHDVVVRSVRDENARALRLLAGRSDIAPNAISPTLLPTLEERPGLSVTTRRGANVTYLLMQNDRAPLDQKRVRHAIAGAIDRDLIVRTLLSGRAEVASFIFPPGHWAHPPGLSPEPFDPEAARAVLSSVRPLTLLTSTERARVTIARVVAQMLSDAGLQVRVVSLDFGVMLARMDAGDFDLATLQMPELTEPHLLSWFFHPRGVPGEGGEGRNRARFRHPEAARLLDAAGATPELEARAPHYAAFARLMADELPVIPLWHEAQVAVVSERAKGFVPSAEGRWLGIASLR